MIILGTTVWTKFGKLPKQKEEKIRDFNSNVDQECVLVGRKFRKNFGISWNEVFWPEAQTGNYSYKVEWKFGFEALLKRRLWLINCELTRFLPLDKRAKTEVLRNFQSSVIENGNGSVIENGNWSVIENGNGSVIENGNWSVIENGNWSVIENGNWSVI